MYSLKKKSKIVHILNLCPPLNLNSIWFKQHCADTIAKYGMFVSVLGMAELKGEVEADASWPKTVMYSATMDILDGSDIESQWRKLEVIANVAYSIFKKPKSVTKNFITDEISLKKKE